MREQEFQELLLSLLTVETEAFDDDLEVAALGPLLQAVGTFKEAGVTDCPRVGTRGCQRRRERVSNHD